jgi:hypothetical protein
MRMMMMKNKYHQNWTPGKNQRSGEGIDNENYGELPLKIIQEAKGSHT